MALEKCLTCPRRSRWICRSPMNTQDCSPLPGVRGFPMGIMIARRLTSAPKRFRNGRFQPKVSQPMAHIEQKATHSILVKLIQASPDSSKIRVAPIAQTTCANVVRLDLPGERQVLDILPISNDQGIPKRLTPRGWFALHRTCSQMSLYAL